MSLPPPIYDLMLLLDSEAEETAHAKVLSDVEQMIGSGGELLRHDDWGSRTLAYQIRHRTEAGYHLFQFHASAELLARLNRALQIADGVLRFRIIKLEPGTPAAPDVRSARRPEPEPAAAAAPSGPEPATAEAPSGPEPAAAPEPTP